MWLFPLPPPYPPPLLVSFLSSASANQIGETPRRDDHGSTTRDFKSRRCVLYRRRTWARVKSEGPTFDAVKGETTGSRGTFGSYTPSEEGSAEEEGMRGPVGLSRRASETTGADRPLLPPPSPAGRTPPQTSAGCSPSRPRPSTEPPYRSFNPYF